MFILSVVAGRVYTDKIVMAADSILVNGWSKKNENFAKIVNINGMIVGAAGDAEEASIFWRYMQSHKPETASEKDVLEFMVEFGKWKTEFTGSSNINNSYLMAYQGHLYEMVGLFVHEISNYEAVGAGQDFANAALYLGHTPREAVKVACDLCCFVSEPVVEYEMSR